MIDMDLNAYFKKEYYMCMSILRNIDIKDDFYNFCFNFNLSI